MFSTTNDYCEKKVEKPASYYAPNIAIEADAEEAGTGRPQSTSLAQEAQGNEQLAARKEEKKWTLASSKDAYRYQKYEDADDLRIDFSDEHDQTGTLRSALLLISIVAPLVCFSIIIVFGAVKVIQHLFKRKNQREVPHGDQQGLRVDQSAASAEASSMDMDAVKPNYAVVSRLSEFSS